MRGESGVALVVSGVYFGQRYSKSQDWGILLFLRSGLDWGTLPSDCTDPGRGGDVEGSALDIAFGCGVLAWRMGALAIMGFLPAYQHRSPWEP
jgi:hypothetical protein